MNTDEIVVADYEQEPKPRHVHIHKDSNGSHRIIWAWALGCTALLAGLGGVAISKVYEVSDRLARVETLLEIVAQHDGVSKP